MEQPFIFKKQIISIIFFSIVLVLFLLFNIDYIYILLFSSYLIILMNITFLPSFKKKYEYPIFIHYILFYLPFITPILYIPIDEKLDFNILGIILGILIGLVFRGISILNENRYYSYNKNLSIAQISNFEFIIEILGSILCVISEEIFFRYIIIGALSHKMELISIFVSSILFVFIHYLNRWANVIFNKKIYTIQFILSLFLGVIFYYFNSLIACILCHFIFNSNQFIILIKRYKVRNKFNIFFDDY